MFKTSISLMGEHRYVQYEQIGNFAYLLSWLHLLQLFSSQKHRLVHTEPISARWQLARFRLWLLLTSTSAPLLSSCSQKKGELVLKLCRHVKKKTRQKPSIKKGEPFPSNKYLYRPCLHNPLPFWAAQQPASQAHPKAWLCMSCFFRHSRGFCFAFVLSI